MKQQFKVAAAFLFIVIVASSCSKNLKESQPETNELSAAQRSQNSGGCQMTSYRYYNTMLDYEQLNQFSYKNGLVDEWTPSYGGVFKIQYTSAGRLKIAHYYVDDEMAFTIHFFYRGNKIVQENWYVGNTSVVEDVVTYTYNAKQQMIKTESSNYDYYTLNTYTHMGELESWTFYLGGILNQKGEYTYDKHYKNPYRSATGISHAFVYVNPAFGTSKSWYASEKITLYDESSNPFVLYDNDPAKTIWQIGAQNYPDVATYLDKTSSSSTVINSFTYANCPGSTSAPQLAGKMKLKTNNAMGGIRHIMHGNNELLSQRMMKMKKRK